MGTLLRIVESQEQKATVELVDNLEEHDLLEEIIEGSKPPVVPGTERFDYLLRSPWRYPPLAWGSRFGTRLMPSIFYGALSEHALFSEAAYYRFVFLAGTTAEIDDRVISLHTVFQARFRTERGIDLCSPPFDAYEAILRHPEDYRPSQALGGLLSESATEAFVYLSARTPGREQNVGLLKPAALRSNKHQNPQQVICETHDDRVQYRDKESVLTIGRDQFLVDGALPQPA